MRRVLGAHTWASQLAYSFCSPTTHFVSKYMGHKNTFQPVKKKGESRREGRDERWTGRWVSVGRERVRQ